MLDPTSRRPVIALALAGLAGCAGGGGHEGFQPPPMPVETVIVQQGTMADRFEAVGTIAAGEAITVVAEIDAAVVAIPFREGEAIRKGGLIAQLDDAQLRAEVARTEALRDQSQVTFDRIQEIVDQGAGAPQDLDDAAASLKVAKANLDLAQARLGKTRITAPFAGMLGARRVSPGAFLRAGQPITDLAQIREVKVVFSTPERYLSVLHLGARVTVSTTAYPDYEFEGQIDVVEPVLDAATRSARVIARVPNPDRKLRPGMSAAIVAILSQRENALTVPNEAIFVEGAQSFVYVVGEDSTVSRSPLELGTRLRDVVEVVSGLTPGTRVVRAGHQKLFDGAKVFPVGGEEASAQVTGGEEPPSVSR